MMYVCMCVCGCCCREGCRYYFRVKINIIGLEYQIRIAEKFSKLMGIIGRVGDT